MENNNEKSLKPPTKEQTKILIEINDGKNIKVDAVAGSGKTTSILHISQNTRASKLCVITYNKKLQTETQYKIQEYGIRNIDIFTYHGSCNRKYLNVNKLITDRELRNVIENDIKSSIIKYDIIIVDEVQDMNHLYCNYIKKFINDNKNKDANIIILGDKNQCINQYNGSDERFLIHGHEIFRNEREWVSLKLTETFRVPQEICDFLNICMLKEKRMISNDGNGSKKYSGYKPRYFIQNSFTKIEWGADYIIREINYYLELKNPDGSFKYKPDDLFILSPSVKNKIGNKSPVIQLANALSSREDKLIYINNDIDCIVEDKILKNKIVFSTHNSTKGLERKVVIIINFDKSYFDYYDKDCDPNVCPNHLYVAVTRSMERLSLFHHYENDYLPFLLGDTREEKFNNINKYCDINPTGKKPGKAFQLDVKPPKINPICYCVTDLVKYLNVDILDELSKLYECTKIIRGGEYGKLNINNESEQKKDQWEIVSDINGTAIPMYFAIKYCNMDINLTDVKLDGVNDNVNILKIANYHNAMVDNSYYKVNQIFNYDWLEDWQLESAMKRLNKLKKQNLISNSGSFEYPISKVSQTTDNIHFTLCGQMDYANLNDKIVLEFKCVEKLDDSHFLQTILYKYINDDRYDKYYTYNIKTDELYELKSSRENLQKIIDILIHNKSYNRMTDEEFLNSL